MSKTATIVLTSDKGVGDLRDILIHDNQQLALNRMQNFLSGVISGSDAASFSMQVNAGDAVNASGTFTCTSTASGDTASVAGVTFTAVDKREKTQVTAIADTGALEALTVTVPSTAGAAQGDYFVISGTTGVKTAFWLDIDANGTAPTGAAYVAATNKIKVSIVTGGTSAQNGTILYAAAHSSVGYNAVDNGDGTVTYTQTLLGNCTNAARHNTGDTGNGSFSFSAQSDGAASNLNNSFFTFFNALDATKYYMWYNVNGQGVDPAVAAATGVSVAISAGASANTVASSSRAKFLLSPLSSGFIGSGATDKIIFQNVSSGATTNSADGTAATGFTFSTTNAGATVGALELQLSGNSADASALATLISANVALVSASSSSNITTVTAGISGPYGNGVLMSATGGIVASGANLSGGANDSAPYTATYNFNR